VCVVYVCACGVCVLGCGVCVVCVVCVCVLCVWCVCMCVCVFMYVCGVCVCVRPFLSCFRSACYHHIYRHVTYHFNKTVETLTVDTTQTPPYVT
jgi:hypothetical protein